MLSKDWYTLSEVSIYVWRVVTVFSYYPFDVCRVCSDIPAFSPHSPFSPLLVMPEVCQFYWQRNQLFLSLTFPHFLKWFSVVFISPLYYFLFSAYLGFILLSFFLSSQGRSFHYWFEAFLIFHCKYLVL